MVDDSARPRGHGLPNCVVILGPTATGKTGLAVHLARTFGGEIISADSRQVYRGLDIGSGKDLGEYGDTPYHLIDVADLSGEYSVFNFQKDFYRVFPEIRARGNLPVIAGGTGMYLDAVIRGYSMKEVPVNEPLRASLETLSLDELAARLLTLKSDIHNRTDLIERPRLVRAIEIAEYSRANGEAPVSDVRPEIRPVILGVKFERACLRARIRARLEARMDEGLVEEVRNLHDAGFSWERLERLGLEYRFTAEFLQEKIDEKSAYVEGLYTAICQFAKRQETWFRGMERKGVKIEWVPEGNRGEAESRLAPYFERMRQRD
jgi:tRNA dimethylallyltransferase